MSLPFNDYLGVFWESISLKAAALAALTGGAAFPALALVPLLTLAELLLEVLDAALLLSS